jgi:ribosomal protein S18 acetylase RimI-like enzyme/predicted nucleotidyltransferase
MTLHIEERHLSILNQILKKYDYSFFAFGSRVHGKNKKFSDLDMFYLEHIPNKDLLILEEDFEESDLPYKVDIIDFNKCDYDFRKIILQNYLCIQSSSKLKTVEQNHLNHFAYLPKNLGFDVCELGGVTVVNCGLQTSMFNITYGAPSDCDLAIDQIKQAYKGEPFAWWIPPSEHNPRTTKALVENGFIIETIEHAMICHLNNVASFAQKTDLMIRQVTKSSMLEDFISILEPYDHHASAFYGRMNDELLQGDEKLVVGYAYGKPVSIGILFVSGDSAGIFSLVTSKDFQGKGYGTDMMVFLMKIAKDYGCHSVTLSASSDSGYRIYERLGFSKVGEFECFEYKIPTINLRKRN